jgi:hypothetical protein
LNGTGETASPEQSQDMHNFIRQINGLKYGNETAENIFYPLWWSVKPANAKKFFHQMSMGLIGGAALNAKRFYRYHAFNIPIGRYTPEKKSRGAFYVISFFLPYMAAKKGCHLQPLTQDTLSKT